jgi:hypothetical protein
MTELEPNTIAPKPNRRPLQFSLRTVLLLFLVLSSSLGVFGAWGIVVFVLTVGLAIFLRQVKSLWSLTYLALAVLCLICLMPALGGSRDAARRAQCTNNLKQIFLALEDYQQVNGCFPPAYIADKNDKPMHSWRVLILPYLQRSDLYQDYDFGEPWDGPTNKKLLANRPAEYACPSDRSTRTPGATQTSYVAVVGSNAAWAGEKPRKHGSVNFPGGMSNTVMLVEVANSGIRWTEPRDLSLDMLGAGDGKSYPLTVSSEHGRHEEFFITTNRPSAEVAMVDGSVHYLLTAGSLSTESLHKILQVGGYREEEIGSYGELHNEQCTLNWPNIAALAVWVLSVGLLLRRAVRSRTARHSTAAGIKNAEGRIESRTEGTAGQ